MPPDFELFQKLGANLSRDPERYIPSISGLPGMEVRAAGAAFARKIRAARRYSLDSGISGVMNDTIHAQRNVAASAKRGLLSVDGGERLVLDLAEGEPAWDNASVDEHSLSVIEGLMSLAPLGRLPFDLVWCEGKFGDEDVFGNLLERDEGGWSMSLASAGCVSPFGVRFSVEGFAPDEGWGDAAAMLPAYPGDQGVPAEERTRLCWRVYCCGMGAGTEVYRHFRPFLGPASASRRGLEALAGMTARERGGRFAGYAGGVTNLTRDALRFGLAALSFVAMLNAGPSRVVPGPARQARAAFGAPAGRRFTEYHTLRLTVPREEVIRDYVALSETGPRDARRRHEVPGHFCYMRKRRGNRARLTCIDRNGPVASRFHRFGPADEDGHEVCQDCNVLRYWRDDCLRGTAEQGFVSQDRAVVGRPGAGAHMGIREPA